MDVEPEIIIEDGEICSDEEVDYTPLQRPVNNIANNVARNIDKHSDNDSDWSSESDSDSDEIAKQAKRPKVKIKTKNFTKQSSRGKKYDIWSSHVQEDVLAETLVSCDVSRIDRSRDVESYNAFDLRQKLGRRQGNKRRNDQRNNKKLSSNKRDDSDEDDTKGCKRVILDLVTTLDNTDDEVAKDIANKLCEEKDDLMLRIVRIAGKKKSIEIFNNTKEIELDGGMLIMNRTRRRTPGGVFIFLLKRDNDITDEQQKEIFSEERREQVRERKAHQKAKLKAIKDKMVAKKSSEKLPMLLKRSELTVQKLSATSDRNESESEEFVNNPPPSPVTDGKETSNDGMSEELVIVAPIIQPHRNLHSYAEDFLDIGSTVDMDMF